MNKTTGVWRDEKLIVYWSQLSKVRRKTIKKDACLPTTAASSFSGMRACTNGNDNNSNDSNQKPRLKQIEPL